jgi:hypothetical protein
VSLRLITHPTARGHAVPIYSKGLPIRSRLAVRSRLPWRKGASAEEALLRTPQADAVELRDSASGIMPHQAPAA